jgi:hypothetical protein
MYWLLGRKSELPTSNKRLVYKTILARGYSWATLFLGGYKYKDLALQVGGVSDETVKYGLSSAGLRPKSDCSGKAHKELYGKLQTRPLVREGATKQ